ncbi:MAG: anti-sigma F factor [bacterium]|jgi:stage II sporulation protein AB (anti-sigma F factor)
MADNTMHLEFPSKAQNVSFARAAVAAFVSQLDPTMPELADISTAVSEGVTNAVVHAYPDGVEGPVAITVQLIGQLVSIDIKDQGCGISDLEAVRRFGTTTCGRERMGIGLSLIEACMDDMELKSKEGEGTHLVMTKRFGQQRGVLAND